MNSEHEGPRPDLGIGGSLQNAREEKGLTLQQVEERTKIRARYLKDLERENFGVLPAVYVLGSLKTYADHLGLNGEALSAELKSRLEPEELAEEPTGDENPRDTEDEYEAAPLLTVGFDHLFLGMGLVLISAFAVMTLVFALATGDGPAVSQLREPAMPEAPSEIALAGNVLEEPERQPRNEAVTPKPESKAGDGQGADRPDPPKDGEDRTEQEPKDTSSQPSFFDGMEFVRMSPASVPTAAATAPAASASPQPTASAGPVPSGSAPPANVPAADATATDASATDVPTATATVPAATTAPASASSVSASAASTSVPSASAPTTAAPTSTPAASAPAAPTPAAPAPGIVGSGSEPGSSTAEPGPAPVARASGGPGTAEMEPGGVDVDGLAGRITDQVDDVVDPVR